MARFLKAAQSTELSDKVGVPFVREGFVPGAHTAAMNDTFRPHGHASFGIRGRIVAIHVRGPWNAELVLQVHAEMHAALEGIREKKAWAVMVIVQGSALFGPDAVEAIRETARSETASMGRVATAWVLDPEVEGATLMPHVIRSLYGDSDRIRLFEALAPAEAWLEERLALADN
jgi:hypothetical protein